MQQEHDLLGEYTHHSGTKYTVVAITNEHATANGWDIEAVYFDETGKWWSRPLHDFQQSCTKIEKK